MGRSWVHITSVCGLVAAVVLTSAGCSKTQSPETTSEKAPSPKVVAVVPRATDRPANADGVVFIVEYHRLAKEEARWDRSIAKFKKDLARLHKLGFRPVTLQSYMSGDMDLPPGASPIVFTFDDSHPSQFRFLEDGTLDPVCAVGIWKAFSEKHPDFPVRATFYVIPPVPWGQKDSLAKKFEMLKEWGCEVGSHTYSHVNLGKIPVSAASAELQKSSDFIQAGFGAAPSSIALPYGIAPKDPTLLKKAGLRAALLVGSNPAPAPNDPKRDPMRLPRIQAIEGDYGLNFWLDKVEAGKVNPYVAGQD